MSDGFPMFANHAGGKFDHVFPSEGQVRMCGDGEVVPVWVRIVSDGETHWGWVDTDRDRPTMIWPRYVQLCLCFQGEGAMLDQVNRGRGKPVRLVVEERT